MTDPGFQPTDKPLGATERADYLDTQTLAGGEGYFHTENAPTHATDGSATSQSPETDLTRSSRGESLQSEDGYDEMTNAELTELAEANGLDVPNRANKAALIALLRGE